MGLWCAGGQLFRLEFGEAWVFSFNAFALSFHVDALSAFFLVAIFAVCLLAAIYSFHYLANPAKALRAAVSYLFFSLLIGSMAMVVCADTLIAFMLSWEIMSLSFVFPGHLRL